MKKHYQGFTLIEVLLALSIIAIALTAMLKLTAQNIANTQYLKEKTISHWVAMQGVSMIQLEQLILPPNTEITNLTKILHQQWYWRAKLSSTPLKSVQQITITVSKNEQGPFTSPLIAYKYKKL